MIHYCPTAGCSGNVTYKRIFSSHFLMKYWEPQCDARETFPIQNQGLKDDIHCSFSNNSEKKKKRPVNMYVCINTEITPKSVQSLSWWATLAEGQLDIYCAALCCPAGASEACQPVQSLTDWNRLDCGVVIPPCWPGTYLQASPFLYFLHLSYSLFASSESTSQVDRSGERLLSQLEFSKS